MALKIICGNFIPKFGSLSPINVISSANFHTSSALAGKINRVRSRSEMLRTVVKKTDGISDPNAIDVDVKRFVLFPINLRHQHSLLCSICSEPFQRFPDANLPNRLFGNVPFKDLPIVHIRVTKNNTIVDATNSKGKTLAINSCGKEGYKNCRKGTNVAGQATAIALAKVCIKCSAIVLKIPK